MEARSRSDVEMVVGPKGEQSQSPVVFGTAVDRAEARNRFGAKEGTLREEENPRFHSCETRTFFACLSWLTIDQGCWKVHRPYLGGRLLRSERSPL